MPEFLLFTLNAPMAAFGTYAGHERRGTELVPGRSAILGLLGAALGITRDDREGWEALRGYRAATQLLSASGALRDYHTVQTVPDKVRHPATRQAALQAIGRKSQTIITVRDYRTDVAIAVAVWAEAARWTLHELAAALQEPAFVPYLGRKSCPLAAPMGPAVMTAPDPVSAIRSAEPSPFVHNAEPGPVASDPFAGGLPDRVETAPVDPLDRTQWHFGQAEVWYFEGGAET